jgi:hypothetical protein
MEQSNSYYLVDSMGRRVDGIWFFASNIREAYQQFRESELYRRYCYGKIVRCYRGGAKG